MNQMYRQRHSGKIMSELQESRIRAGKLESNISDYQQGTDIQKKLGAARRKLEDLRMERELDSL